MQIYIRLMISVLVSGAIGCANSASKEPGESSVTIKSDLIPTDRHIKLPFSDFYIIPPTGFSIDSLTRGLRKPNELKYEANFVPMKIFAGTTALEYTLGVKAASQKDFPGTWQEESVTVSGQPAKICRYQVMEGVRIWHLYFLDKWSDQLLLANYDAADEPAGEEMHQALKTVIVKP